MNFENFAIFVYWLYRLTDQRRSAKLSTRVKLDRFVILGASDES